MPDKCDAMAIRAMMARQMDAAGMKVWGEDMCHQQDSHVTVFLFVSDQGGDTKGTDPIMEREFPEMPRAMYVRDWCGRHESALVQGKMLKHMENGRWWSVLAKVVNTWRQTNGVKRMIAILEEGMGGEKAAPLWHRCPPRPLRGR